MRREPVHLGRLAVGANMQSTELVGVLEAIYAVELPESMWLRGVVEAMRPSIEDGLGMAAYLYDASVRPIRVREPILDCPLDANGLSALMGSSDESYVRGSWLSRVAATASETPGFAAHPGVSAIFHPLGIRDVMVINALDPVGIGCLVGAPLRKERTLTELDRSRWERVGVHMQTALRLRRRLAATADTLDEGASGAVEAVFKSSGAVEHLEAPAKSARSTLREAVLGVDRARKRLRQRPDHALASWKAIVHGRWTLIDDFKSDGARFIVARANRPSDDGPPTLSARERQVLRCLALGHSQKVIAYELNVSPSTVRVLLARARTKLGARDRDDLIEKFRSISLGT